MAFRHTTAKHNSINSCSAKIYHQQLIKRKGKCNSEIRTCNDVSIDGMLSASNLNIEACPPPPLPLPADAAGSGAIIGAAAADMPATDLFSAAEASTIQLRLEVTTNNSHHTIRRAQEKHQAYNHSSALYEIGEASRPRPTDAARRWRCRHATTKFVSATEASTIQLRLMVRKTRHLLLGYSCCHDWQFSLLSFDYGSNIFYPLALYSMLRDPCWRLLVRRILSLY